MAFAKASRLTLFYLLFVAGCTTVPNDDASKIAKAGQEISTTASTAFATTSRDIALITRRQLLRSSVEQCRAQLIQAETRTKSKLNNGSNPPTICSPSPQTDATRDAEQSNTKLQVLFASRSNAWIALNSAYGELQKEADYDSGADLEGAVTKLTTSLNGFGTALAALSGGNTASILPLGPILKRIGGQSARAAQLRRIRQANEQLILLNSRFIELLKEEKVVVASIVSRTEGGIANFEVTLLNAGIVDPAAILTPVTQGLGRELSTNANSNNPLAVVAAQSWLLSGQEGSKNRHQQTIDQLIVALEKLNKEQVALIANKPADLVGITQQIESITAWIAAANEARKGDYSGASDNE